MARVVESGDFAFEVTNVPRFNSHWHFFPTLFGGLFVVVTRQCGPQIRLSEAELNLLALFEIVKSLVFLAK